MTRRIFAVLLVLSVTTALFAADKICSACKGSGTSSFPCFHCNGSGKSNGFKCTFCNGKGFGKCSSCGGTGTRK